MHNVHSDFRLRPIGRLGLGVALLGCLLAPTASLADPEDAFNFVGAASLRFEDNLFRLDDKAQAQALLGETRMSDWVTSASAGIKIDKRYSLQRFQVDALATHTRHETFDFLDFDSFNYRAAWLWSVTPRLTGVLSADRQEMLTSFSDFRGTNSTVPLNRKNTQTNESRIFSFDGDIGAGFHVIGGASELRSRNSQSFQPVGDYVQDGIELGGKYVSRAENWVSLVQREIKGEYRGRELNFFSQLDTDFDQSETEARMLWRITGKSEINARLTYVEREHDHFSSRDYSGVTGSLNYRWIPTGKLYIDTSLTRGLSSFQELTSSYYDADTLAIAPTWAVTAKTKIRLKYSYGERDYKGALIQPVEQREDKLQSLVLSADWQATRTILVNGTLSREERDSNLSGLDYEANMIGLSAQVIF